MKIQYLWLVSIAVVMRSLWVSKECIYFKTLKAMYMRMETSRQSLNDTYVVRCVSGPVRLVLSILEGFGIQA